MIARGALWNPSIFSPPQCLSHPSLSLSSSSSLFPSSPPTPSSPLPIFSRVAPHKFSLMQEYVKYSVVWDNIHQNVKYVLSKMSEHDDPEGMEKIKMWKDMREICDGMGVGEFYRENRSRMREIESGGRKRKHCGEGEEEEG